VTSTALGRSGRAVPLDLPRAPLAWFTVAVMRRVGRPVALLLLVAAVLCSPAGVCALDAVAAPAPEDHRAHACCDPADGTFLTAHEGSCCSGPGTGFLNIARFMLQKDVLPPVAMTAEAWAGKAVASAPLTFDRRAPLILRI
jgi:hypothetical protein